MIAVLRGDSASPPRRAREHQGDSRMMDFGRSTKTTLWKLGLLPAILCLMSAGRARAHLELTLIEVTPLGSDFQYTYAVTLTADSMLTPAGGGPNNGFSPSNNFFTLYDIPGLIPGSVTYGGPLGIAGFSACTEMLLGDTAPGEKPLPPDSGRIPNITTYWTGPDVAAPLESDVPLGTFSFVSTNPLGMRPLAYTAATQGLDGAPEAPANNFSLVAGPDEPTPASVP